MKEIKLTEFWRLIKTDKYGWVPAPYGNIYCPICSSFMVLHRFFGGHASRGFYHIDVEVKCTQCGLVLIFGVPTTMENVERVRSSPMHHKTLTHEVNDIIKIWNIEGSFEEKIVKERLRRWGYW